jgi:hypothetical protein
MPDVVFIAIPGDHEDAMIGLTLHAIVRAVAKRVIVVLIAPI